MSIYECDECGNYRDDDFDPCMEHPENKSKCICEKCMEKFDDEGKRWEDE